MESRRGADRWFRVAVAMAVLSTLGATLTVFVIARGAAAARDDDRQAALSVTDRLESGLTAITASLAGANALGTDGTVDVTEFTAFATDVVAAASFLALAYAEVVPGANRATWEATTGVSIRDTDGRGGFTPAADRGAYAVVRYVVPELEANRSVVGFDILSDELRARGAARAAAARGPSLVGPVRLATSGQPGLFVTIAVRDPSGHVLGYIASGLALDGIIDDLEALPHVTNIGIGLDGDVLLERGQGAASTSFVLAGQAFSVRASDDRRAGWLLPITTGFGTLVLTASAVVATRRERRHRQRRERRVERSEQLAALAETLVAAATTEAVVSTVADAAGAVLGAAHTNVARRSLDQSDVLEITHDSAMATALAQRYSRQRVSDDLPLPDAARTGSTVLVPDRTEFSRRYPHAVDDLRAAGIRAVLCTPLSLGGDRSVGAIGFAFDHDLATDDIDDLTDAATLVSQMTGRAFERAQARELIQQRVELLSGFAQRLNASRTTDDVAGCVERLLPALLDLEAAELLQGVAPPDTPTVRHSPPASPDGHHVRFVLAPERRRWTRTDETVAATVVDLVEGALARTRLYDQGQEVLLRFQDSLLTTPPAVAGFDIAVRYRSALEGIGIGGDWYSVVDTPSAVHAVIGDVAGHGPDAVALMAEVKTVMRHLLANDVPIEEVVEHAHRTLLRRDAFASAAVVRIDKATETLSYVNAGHLPLVLLDAEGTTHLGDAHRPWLGLDPSTPTSSSTVPFRAGDLLLLYTDGLVEQRGELIDTSIRRRLHDVDRGASCSAVVERLVTTRLAHRDAATVDDDIAIIAIRRA